MADYYGQYLTTMATVGGTQMASPLEVHPPAIAGVPVLSTIAGPLPGSFALTYVPAFPESAHYPTKPAKGRRKPAPPGTDHVKHRRTRSGCYTCRTRRVKCDETRTICERMSSFLSPLDLLLISS